VEVTYAINTYTVSASVTGGHGSVAPASQTVIHGQSASISIAVDAGYHIASIRDNGVVQTVANPYVITSVTAIHTIEVIIQDDFPWEIFLPAILNRPQQ
jgi:hypothetical protein